MRLINLSGLTFGQWTVISRAKPQNGETLWKCRCTCGKEAKVGAKNLRRGLSRSCGCASKEFHGESESIEYATWRRINQRCTNPNNRDWHLYGGRGIRVEWTSFSEFLADMGPRPSPKHSVDRIDPNGPYAGPNCRWATAKQQARNMRVNRLLSARGETRCLSEWAEVTGLSRSCIEKRIDNLGWSIEKALFTPLRGS